MRFRYLRIAVLAGILAATASADSTRRNSTLREERLPPSGRNDIAAIGASVGDEDRAGRVRDNLMPISDFAKEVLLNGRDAQDKAVNKLLKKYSAMIRERKTPHELYKELVGFEAKEEVLTTNEWKSWAFFASIYSVHIREDPLEYIVEVMSNLYGAGQLSKILAVAVHDSKMKNLAEKLQEAQVSSWLQKQYQPQQVYDLLKAGEVTVDDNLDHPLAATYARYLERLREVENKRNVVATVVSDRHEIMEYGSKLRKLMLPENALDPQSAEHLQVVMSDGLKKSFSPDQIVSMLLENVKDSDHQLRLLFEYVPIRNFWMEYAKKFNRLHPGLLAPLFEKITSICGLPKLLVWLHAAVNVPDRYFSDMVRWYVELQFSEWKKSRVTDISFMMPDLTTNPVIEAMKNAYSKYYHTV